MTVWIKQGVQGNLQPIIRKAFGRVANYLSQMGEDTFITSIRDGNHLSGSLHYDGLAFDIRLSKHLNFAVLRDILGDGFDIVFEATHIHIEYDPKGVL